MANFIDIVENTSLENIKDVPPLPTGTYLAVIVGHHEMIKSSKQQTDGCQITLRLVQARDDVDQEQLSSYLEASNQNLRDVQIRHVIWDSPYAASTLRNLLIETLGVSPGLPVKQALAEIPGQELLVGVIHRPFTDNSGKARLRAEIGSTARAL